MKQPACSARHSRGIAVTEYLVILVALMAIWLTADVVLNAVNTYYSDFTSVISQTTTGGDPQ